MPIRNLLPLDELKRVCSTESLIHFGLHEKKHRATVQGGKWKNANSAMQEPIQLQSYYAHSTLNCSCSHLQYLQDDIKTVLKKLLAPPEQLTTNSVFKPKPNLTTCIVIPVS